MTLHVNLLGGEYMEIRHVRLTTTYVKEVIGKPEIVVHFEDEVMMPQMNIPLADVSNFWIAK